MRNKTAITILENIEYYLITHTNESCEQEHTAIALAIKALEETERTQGNCDISLPEIRWTDKLSLDNDGNIRDFSGNLVYPARPQGEWIKINSLGNGNAQYECSNCYHNDEQAESQEVPYCWHCGAKMKGGKK